MGVVPTSKIKRVPKWTDTSGGATPAPTAAPVVKAKPKAKPNPAKAPFSVFKQPYKTQGDFNAAAHESAMSQVQPTLDDISAQEREAQGAHTTREQELQGWSGWMSDRLKSAFGDTTNALNKLITTSSQGSEADRANLAAALAAPSNINQVGGVPNQDKDILAAASRIGEADRTALTGQAGAFAGGAGDRMTLAPVFAGEAERSEQGRLAALLKGLTQKRSDAMGQVPGLEKTAATDLYNQAIQRGNLSESHANRLFQQWLAGQQLGQSAQNQSFQQGLATDTLNLDKAKFTEQQIVDQQTIGLNRDKLNAAINPKGGDPKKAQAKAKQWNNGVTLLATYVSEFRNQKNNTMQVVDPNNPGKTLTVKTDTNGKPLTYKDPQGNTQYVVGSSTPTTYPHFDDAIRILTGQAGLSRSDALRILQTSNFASWRDRAKADLIRLKRRKAGLKNPSKIIKNPTGLTPLSKTSPVK